MKAWEEFLSKQEGILGKSTVDKWLRPLRVARFDACNLHLEAEDSFKLVWFEEHIRPQLSTSLFNNNKKNIKVHITVGSGEKPKPKKKESKEDVPIFSLRFDGLDPKCTFASFISSKSNLLGYKLLFDGDAAGSFNPIYLFGRSGVGKTHLMMAAAHRAQEEGKRVIYVRAETFTNHVVGAIRSSQMQMFRKAYRNVDALLIDDIEVLSRKGATQEELFHTFNTLHVEGKQIILAGNCPPGELKHVEPRLISRFEWGIVIPLKMLEEAEMSQLLAERSRTIDFSLQEEMKSFLLENFGGNAKKLVRALDALVLRTHLTPHATFAPATLKKMLSDLLEEEQKALLTPAKIIRTVAGHYGITMDDILSKSQARECALPRQIAMHLCREQLALPYMKIGDLFSRDHSTVMSSIKQIQKGIDAKDQEVAAAVRLLREQLAR